MRTAVSHIQASKVFKRGVGSRCCNYWHYALANCKFISSPITQSGTQSYSKQKRTTLPDLLLIVGKKKHDETDKIGKKGRNVEWEHRERGTFGSK